MDVGNYQTDPYACLTTPVVGGVDTPPEGIDWSVSSTGSSVLRLPLPLSRWRDASPSLALFYGSDAGNGVFGLGFHVPVPSIRRDTTEGVPRFDDSDGYVGPDGERLVATDSRTVDQIGGIALPHTWKAVRYRPQVDSRSDRIEQWSAEGKTPLWVVHAADGSIAVYGHDDTTTLRKAARPSDIAVWFLCESVTARGEHAVYSYRAEDGHGVADTRDTCAARYLSHIRYGHRRGSLAPFAFVPPVQPLTFYFEAIFDYGQRTLDPDIGPPYAEDRPWSTRRDPFCDVDYGFEHRTLRLCRQLLIYHRLPALGPDPVLVRRVLFEYDEQPWLTRMTSLQTLAYGAQGDVERSPRVDIAWTDFDSADASAHPLDSASGVDDGYRATLIDLYGDGIPGILNRECETWTYREPVRATGGEDAITYGTPVALAIQPSIRGFDASVHPSQGAVFVGAPPAVPARRMLADVTADGALSWIVADPALRGYFTLRSDRTWSAFQPFPSIPMDFRHHDVQWADLTGAGQMDMLLISSHAVIWWPRNRHGYGRARKVAHESDGLPLAASPNTYVGFAPVLCKGTAQLVRVNEDGIVECWPGLGYGHFGQAVHVGTINLPGIALERSRLHFADIEGKGVADILYCDSKALLWYRNLSGHGFAPAIAYAWPDGQRYERTWTVSFAPARGDGISAIISLPHVGNRLKPRHWRMDFFHVPPHRICGTDNHRGASTAVTYRASGHTTLDDKAAGRCVTSHLPFPLLTTSMIETFDATFQTSHRISFEWRDGYYDPIDRRMRGFAFRQERREQRTAMPGLTSDVLTRRWNYVGNADIDSRRDGFDVSDAQAIGVGPDLFSRWTGNGDVIMDPADPFPDGDRWRSLAGLERRYEVFTVSDTSVRSTPLKVVEWRYLVRQLRQEDDGSPATSSCLPIEILTYDYEDSPVDPRRLHSFALDNDVHGCPGLVIEIACSRRNAASPYSQPEKQRLWEDSHDRSQERHHVTLTRRTWWHLTDPDAYCLRVPSETRVHASFVANDNLSEHDMRYETFARDPTFAPNDDVRLVTLTRVVYASDPAVPPAFPPLPRSMLIAGMDEEALAECRLVLDPTALDEHLARGGWRPLVASLLGDNESLQATEHDLCDYASEDDCFAVIRHAACATTDAVTFVRDEAGLFVTGWTCPGDLHMEASYDYRALLPRRVVDANDNVHETAFDASGRVLATSFHGSEHDSGGRSVEVGFESLEDWSVPLDRRPSAALAAAKSTLGNVAEVFRYASEAPAHVVRLTADRYPGDPASQVQQTVWHRDGLGRVVCTAQRSATDTAADWVKHTRIPAPGSGEALQICRAHTSADWRFTAGNTGPATHIGYDALDRIIHVTDGVGRIRRVSYHAWYTVDEDENATAESDMSVHPGSPSLIAIGTNGRPMRECRYLRRSVTDAPVLQLTRRDADAAGRTLRHYDARSVGRDEAVRRESAHLGGTRSWSADAGEWWRVGADTGDDLWIRDALGHEHVFLRDRAGRLTDVHSRSGETGEVRRVMRVDYTTPSIARREANLAGFPAATFDAGGSEVVSRAALTGEVQATERRIIVSDEADWPASGDGGQLESTAYLTTAQYDALGQPLALIDAQGNARQFAYDVAGRLAAASFVANAAGGGDYDVATSLRYEADGLLASRVGPGEILCTQDHDARDGRLTRTRAVMPDGRIVVDRTFRYDPAGTVIRIDDASAPFAGSETTHRSFRYDSTGQLVEATGREQDAAGRGPDLPPPLTLPPDAGETLPRAYSRAFDYDANGNITSIMHSVEGDESASYTQRMTIAPLSNRSVPAEPGLCPEDVDARFDGAGHMLALAPTGPALLWNVQGRLQEVVAPTPEHYTYAADGRRLRKREGSARVVYLPGLELHSGGGSTRSVATMYAADSVARFAYRIGDASSLEMRFHLEAHPLHASTVLDQAGGVTLFEEYYPFGGTSIHAARTANDAQPDDCRYSGETRDSTGLYDYGARYYMPWQHRWTSPDPAGDIDGSNRYRMVRNAPLSLRDADGRVPVPTGHGRENTRRPAETRPARGRVGRVGRPPRMLRQVPTERGERNPVRGVAIDGTSPIQQVTGAATMSWPAARSTFSFRSWNATPLSNIEMLPSGGRPRILHASGDAGIDNFVMVQSTVTRAPVPPEITDPSTRAGLAETSVLTIARSSEVFGSNPQLQSGDHLRLDPRHSFQAYFVAQGGSTVIPAHPDGTQPRVLLTPDFSGCSLVAWQTDESTYRIFHVSGGHEYEEFNRHVQPDATEPLPGFGVAGMMSYAHYAFEARPDYRGGGRLARNNLGTEYISGFAFMEYTDRWRIHYQQHMTMTRVPHPHIRGHIATIGNTNLRAAREVELHDPRGRPPTSTGSDVDPMSPSLIIASTPASRYSLRSSRSSLGSIGSGGSPMSPTDSARTRRSSSRLSSASSVWMAPGDS
ncbi:RHS repeat-associated core domain-containing protein [Luteibacter sp. 22Crub2.1]|nr:RHS repeat-associated core domain-containing protein [Luteibacter sp. 22Crub2.1]